MKPKFRKPTLRGTLAAIVTDRKLPVAAVMALALTASFNTFASGAAGTLEVQTLHTTGVGLANAPVSIECTDKEGAVKLKEQATSDANGLISRKMPTVRPVTCKIQALDTRALVGQPAQEISIDAGGQAVVRFEFKIG